MGQASSGHLGHGEGAEPVLCRGCGTSAYSGEMFCVSCGAYLGWDAPVRPEEPPPPRARPGEVRSAPEMRRHTAGATVVPPFRSGGVEPLPVPPLDVAQGHSAMLFAPTPSAAGEVKADGATYPCPACHGPNGADRTFCQPCGAPMRPAPEPVPPTRLQRLRAVRRRRPDVWHWDRRWGVAVAALPLCLCVGVSAGAAAAAAQHAFPLVEDRFGAQYAVAPDSVSASSAAKGFEAAYASDGVDNKAWAPKGSGEDAVGQEWTAAFGTPFRLTTLLIVNGASTSPGQFFESGRPTKISVRVDTADGSTVEKDVTLGARPGPQRFDLGIDKVTRVSLVLRSTNPGLTARAPVAMAEIQFFTRKSA